MLFNKKIPPRLKFCLKNNINLAHRTHHIQQCWNPNYFTIFQTMAPAAITWLVCATDADNAMPGHGICADASIYKCGLSYSVIENFVPFIFFFTLMSLPVFCTYTLCNNISQIKVMQQRWTASNLKLLKLGQAPKQLIVDVP